MKTLTYIDIFNKFILTLEYWDILIFWHLPPTLFFLTTPPTSNWAKLQANTHYKWNKNRKPVEMSESLVGSGQIVHRVSSSWELWWEFVKIAIFPLTVSWDLTSLLHSRYLGCHAMLVNKAPQEALRDKTSNACGGNNFVPRSSQGGRERTREPGYKGDYNVGSHLIGHWRFPFK